MRILLLIDHFGAGGAQEIVIEILRGLASSKEISLEVASLFAGDACSDRIAATGAKVHHLETGLPYRPWAVPDPRITLRLARLLKHGRYAAVHVHLYAAPLHLYLACLISGQRPHIFNTIHAQRAHLPGYVFPCLRLLRSSTDYFVAEAKTSIFDLRKVGVPPEKLAYIPIGIRPLSIASPSEIAHWRAQIGIAPGTEIVISVARLHPQRQIHRIINGFAIFTARNPETAAVLVLVGDGEQRSNLEDLVTRRNLKQRVVFTGHSDNLPVLMGSASIYAGLEIQGDLSIAPMQGLSIGIPCVALDFEARRRITEHDLSDVDLCLVEPDEAGFADALQRVFESPALRKRLSEHGRNVVLQQRLVSSMVAGYEFLYKGGNPRQSTTLSEPGTTLGHCNILPPENRPRESMHG